MKKLVQFSIPVGGLKNGLHDYQFKIDDEFFSHFENSPIKNGEFDISMVFDKRPDMFVLDFEFNGSVKTACDRCLTDIDLPVVGKQQLMVKFAEEPKEDDVIIYIPIETQIFNVSKLIYECVVLGFPLIKVFDCEDIEPQICDQKMLDYLDQKNDSTPSSESTDSTGGIWDELKNFGKSNN